jgi:inorganic pyrophosphatase
MALESNGKRADVAPPVDVVIEIPAGTRNKYEVDPATGALWLTRQLPASMVYPADYGFVPQTLAEDGDPLDAVVLIDEPTVPGCHVRVVALGVLWLHDEEGKDPRLITVLEEQARREHLEGIADLPERLLTEIEHFFGVYKDLEDGKASHTGGYGDRQEAAAVLEASRGRFADEGRG